jgi:putative FmdB family regulatory protein
MPTYEYACRDCGRHFEVVQSFSDAPLTKCPSCGGTLKKVFSPVGIVLKGSGFYKTDSRSTTGTGAKKEAAGGDSGTPDKKPEKKAAESSGDRSSTEKTSTEKKSTEKSA